MPLHVIIIGAGLGGLTLAHGLTNAGVSCAIYERDLGGAYRPQGYRLRISPDGSSCIQQSVSEQSWLLFKESAAITTLGMTSINPISGESASRPGYDKSKPGNPEDVYTVDRTVLRSVLMHGIEELIHYNKEFQKYTILPDGKVEVEFTGGEIVRGDILVGADGVHSRVRRQYLPNHGPVDAGGRLIYGKTIITPDLLARFPKEGQSWITQITDSRPMTLFLEPVRFTKDPACISPILPSVKDYIYWVLLSREIHFNMDDNQLFSLSKDQIKDLTLTLTEDWQSSIRSLLELQDITQVSVLRTSTMVPNADPWSPSQVTLLGDAIHAMSPTGGQGANSALRDALVLAKAIIAANNNTEDKQALLNAIGNYEADMRERGSNAIQQSSIVGKKMYNMLLFENCKPIVYNQ